MALTAALLLRLRRDDAVLQAGLIVWLLALFTIELALVHEAVWKVHAFTLPVKTDVCNVTRSLLHLADANNATLATGFFWQHAVVLRRISCIELITCIVILPFVPHFQIFIGRGSGK